MKPRKKAIFIAPNTWLSNREVMAKIGHLTDGDNDFEDCQWGGGPSGRPLLTGGDYTYPEFRAIIFRITLWGVAQNRGWSNLWRPRV